MPPHTKKPSITPAMSQHKTEPLRTLLIDDSPRIIQLLRNYLDKHCPDVEVIGDTGFVSEAHQMIHELHPDLLFLDIVLKGGTGFDLLRKLEEDPPYVVFITAFGTKENTLQALRYSAIDFIDKPISPERVREAVLRAHHRQYKKIQFQQQLNLLFDRLQQKSNYIAVPVSRGELEMVEVDQIRWIESDGQVSYFHLRDNQTQTLTAMRNIGYFDDMLTRDYPFFRIRDNILLNTGFVKRYKNSELIVKLHDGKKFNVARRRSADFRDYLINRRRKRGGNFWGMFDLFN